MEGEFDSYEFATSTRLGQFVKKQAYRCAACADRLELGAAVFGAVLNSVERKWFMCAVHAECCRAGDVRPNVEALQEWAAAVNPDVSDALRANTMRRVLGIPVQ